MKSMFRDFVKRKADRLLKEMAWGRSYAGRWSLPTTQPMANLLSLIDGKARRISALQWFMTDGLVEASNGRDELCLRVNKAIIHERGKGISVGTQGSIAPSAKVAGMVGEAQHGYSHQGQVEAGVEFEADIFPVDLFSPKAREREPLLAGPLQLLGGKTIDEVYEEEYEPQEIKIQSGYGDPEVIDLLDLNHDLEAYGLEPFKFGGVNGYMEYIERGRDWLDEEEMRSPDDPNDQQGPDLSFAHSTVDPDSHEMIVQFQVGAVTKERKKFVRKLTQMQSDFSNLADRIQSGEEMEVPQGMSPEQFEQIKNLVMARDRLKRSEEEFKGRCSISAKVCGIQGGAQRYVTPECHQIQMILDNVRKGLAQPQEFGEPIWPEAVWNNPKIFKTVDKSSRKWRAILTDEAQEVVFNHLTRLLESQDTLITNDRWRNCLKSLIGPLWSESNKDATLYASKLFDQGVRSDPATLEQMKDVGYVMTHDAQGQPIDPTQRLKRLETSTEPLDDELLEELLASGYQWYLPQLASPELKKDDPRAYTDAEKTWEKEVATGKPNWDHPLRQAKGAKLVFQQGDNRHDIVKVTYEDGQLYLDVPLESGDWGSAPERGEKHRPMLRGGGRRGRITASLGRGHIESNPLRYEKDWKKLLDALKQGKYGEPLDSPIWDETKLPCVKRGVGLGYSRACMWRGMESWLPNPLKGEEKNQISPDMFYSWAIEGLRGFSADPAFKYGYLGSEVEKILGWSREGEIEKQRLKDAEPDPDKQAKMRGGYGIYSLLHQNKIEDPDEQDRVVQDVQALVKQGVDWDTFVQTVNDDKIIKAVGENAFMARVRAIANVIRRRASALYYAELKKRQVSAEDMKGTGKEGEELSGNMAFDPQIQGSGKTDYEAQRTDMRSDWEDENKGVMSAAEKRRRAGVPEGEPASRRPPHRVTTATPDAPTQQDKPALDAPAEKQSLLQTFPQQQPEQPEPKPQPAAKQSLLQTFGTPETAPSMRYDPEAESPLAGKMRRKKSMQEHFKSYKQWKEYTSAVYDGTKPKDGCGFNWWGAVGHPLGVSITGEPLKKGKKSHGRKQQPQVKQ